MDDIAQKLKTEVTRVNGYLREIITVFDSSGKPISQVMNPLMTELKPRDVLQLFVGAFLVAAPLSFTEEIWTLSETLPEENAYALGALSLFVVTLFIYFNFYRYRLNGNLINFAKRAFATYLVPLVSIVLLLFLIDKFPYETQPWVTMKRVIIIGFPATFGAVISDYLK